MQLSAALSAMPAVVYLIFLDRHGLRVILGTKQNIQDKATCDSRDYNTCGGAKYVVKLTLSTRVPF
jgi:hypothetical protein